MAFIAVMAVPAKKGQWRTLTLADGSKVKAELVGDEFLHYWQAEDGICYVRNAEHFEKANLEAMKAVAMQKTQQRSAKHRALNRARKCGSVSGTTPH